MSLSLNSQTVNVDRKALLAVLKTNRSKHINDYKEAVYNYREALRADLTQALADATDKSKKLHEIRVEFNHPVSHEADYTNIIDMLEVSVDETIRLESSAFRAYYKDEWMWKSQFDLANRTYAMKASTFAGQKGA